MGAKSGNDDKLKAVQVTSQSSELASGAYTFPLRVENGAIHTGTPTANTHAATKKYVDDRALTDTHKTVLNFLASKIGTPNVIFGTDASGQLTAMTINDLATAIMQALPAAEEGEF
jgi:hypothetical protein